LGLVYKERYSDAPEYPATFYDETYDTFILSLFKKYNSLNIFLNRNDSTYDQNGRFQDLDESKQIDEEIKHKLVSNNIDFIEFNVNQETSLDIFNYITKNKL
jgi:hypothetical protein